MEWSDILEILLAIIAPIIANIVAGLFSEPSASFFRRSIIYYYIITSVADESDYKDLTIDYCGKRMIYKDTVIFWNNGHHKVINFSKQSPLIVCEEGVSLVAANIIGTTDDEFTGVKNLRLDEKSLYVNINSLGYNQGVALSLFYERTSKCSEGAYDLNIILDEKSIPVIEAKLRNESKHELLNKLTKFSIYLTIIITALLLLVAFLPLPESNNLKQILFSSLFCFDFVYYILGVITPLVIRFVLLIIHKTIPTSLNVIKKNKLDNHK